MAADLPNLLKGAGIDTTTVRAEGRRRVYRVNGEALRPVHEWVRAFERTWNARLDRLDDVLAELQSTEEERS